jgi:hypothetical protein
MWLRHDQLDRGERDDGGARRAEAAAYHEQERETLKRAVTLFVRETRSALTLPADRGAAAARHGDLAARPDASRWGDPQRRAE